MNATNKITPFDKPHMSAKVQIEQVSKIAIQSKKVKSEQYDMKILLNSFHLNGQTQGIDPQC